LRINSLSIRQDLRARPGATEAGQCHGEKNPVWARDNQDVFLPFRLPTTCPPLPRMPAFGLYAVHGDGRRVARPPDIVRGFSRDGRAAQARRAGKKGKNLNPSSKERLPSKLSSLRGVSPTGRRQESDEKENPSNPVNPV